MTRNAVVTDWGRRASQYLAKIASISEPGAGVTRLPFTNEHRRALAEITGWMQTANLEVHLDAAGTLIGRSKAPKSAPTLLMGSHQDSVRHGGAFDGIMGVALPILALERLEQEGQRLPFAVEVLAFADEEGVRFPTALIGPRALAGSLDPAVLEMCDAEGTSLRQAMLDFGLAPDKIGTLRRDPATVIGYLETHIEQGPVLESAGQALGVVTAICGIERHQVRFRGVTGHAGTLPMEGRRDALVGAAGLVTEVNRLAHANKTLRATVGTLTALPGVVNAVPADVRLSVELRAPDDLVREQAGQALHTIAKTIANSHGLDLNIARSYHQPAQPCDEALTIHLQAALQATGSQGLRLASGATHDASALADLCPVAMMFVRCRDGVSHAPQEYASADDLGSAIDALCKFLTALANKSPS